MGYHPVKNSLKKITRDLVRKGFIFINPCFTKSRGRQRETTQLKICPKNYNREDTLHGNRQRSESNMAIEEEEDEELKLGFF